LSYAIYLNHYLIIKLLKHNYFPEYQTKMLLPYLPLLLIYSIITERLVNGPLKKAVHAAWVRLDSVV